MAVGDGGFICDMNGLNPVDWVTDGNIPDGFIVEFIKGFANWPLK